jgi:glycosyltransferase involved in cell wall biosynthesis
VLSVVIPAFNEARRLPATLAEIASFLDRNDHWQPAEILVVDDGSSDDTADKARLAAPLSPQVTCRALRLERNRGKGAAVRTGLAASRGAWVLLTDADLAAPVVEVEALRRAGVTLAVGSRAVRRELIGRRQPLQRDLLGRAFNLLLRTLGLTAMLDTQCGFKLVEGDLARRLAAVLRLDGFAYDVELLARGRRMGATLAEVPVRWSHVDDSRVRPLRHGVRMVCDALRLRWWLWTGR